MKRFNNTIAILLIFAACLTQSAFAIEYGNPTSQYQMTSPFLKFDFDTTDKTADTIKNSYNWNKYNKNLQKKLNSQITIKRNSPIALEFDISKDGNITNLKIITSSGNQEFDKYIQNSIETCAPFETLPSKYKGSKIKVKLNIYNGALSSSVSENE